MHQIFNEDFDVLLPGLLFVILKIQGQDFARVQDGIVSISTFRKHVGGPICLMARLLKQ